MGLNVVRSRAEPRAALSSPLHADGLTKAAPLLLRKGAGRNPQRRADGPSRSAEEGKGWRPPPTVRFDGATRPKDGLGRIEATFGHILGSPGLGLME